MYNKNGFLLMEFVVYFFLLVLLGSLIGSVLLSTKSAADKQKNMHQTTLSSWFAADRFVADIRRAPGSKKMWKKNAHSYVVWQQGACDIGWCVERGTLYRIEGTWNQAQEMWSKHTKNLVADNLKKCDMQVRYDAQGKNVVGCSIEIHSGDDKHAVRRLAAVRGGEIYV